tara:strand:+ start:210 stop:863 length:654 start_codon:yes stop_codon:yes gene_type:complete
LKRALAISLVLILIACSSTKSLPRDQIFGKYQWVGFYGHLLTIELKEDKTFEYNWKLHMWSGTTIGTWENEEDTVILNSSIQPNDIPKKAFEIIKTEKSQSDSITIIVIGKENNLLPFVNCVLKRDNTFLIGATTNFRGEAKLPKALADSMHLSFIGYRTINHPVDTTVSKYVFKMEEGDETYKFFKDERWIHDNEKLYDPTFEAPKAKKSYYEKIK